jgi:hypothetical protein
MPVKVRKLPNKNRYKVYDPKTGRIHAKSTSFAKATAQKRLLDRIAKSKK